MEKQNGIKRFANLPVYSGITTNVLGDFSFHEKESNIPNLIEITGSKNYFKIKPEHSNRVVFTDNYNGKKEIACDAIIHRKASAEKVILIATTGDCPIVVFFSKEHKTIGIAHSGWRGTKKNIASNVIEAFKFLDINPKNILVGIHTGICKYCYKVGNEFEFIFPKYFEKNRIDLCQIIIDQLCEKEVKESNIVNNNKCSAHSIEKKGEFIFFSNRRDGTKKRNAVFITI